jgi:uncharacterized membrane protein YgcG
MLFLSYSRREWYFAEYLTLHLQKLGIPVWFDIQQLEPGVNWRLDIEKGLQACQSLILVASESALSSPYVELEWQRALRDKKPVYVVLFEGVELPPLLASKGTLIDFRRETVSALQELAKQIAAQSQSSVANPESRVYPKRFQELRSEIIRNALVEALLFALFILCFSFWGIYARMTGQSVSSFAVLLIFGILGWGFFRIFRRTRERLSRLLARTFPYDKTLLKQGQLLRREYGDKRLGKWIEKNQELIIRARNHAVPNKIRIMMYQKLLPETIAVSIVRGNKTPYIMPKFEQKITYQVYAARTDNKLAQEIQSLLSMVGFQRALEGESSAYQLVILTAALEQRAIQSIFNQNQKVVAVLCDNNDYSAIEPRIQEHQLVDYRARNQEALASYFAYLHTENMGYRAILSLNLVPTNLQIKVFVGQDELLYQVYRSNQTNSDGGGVWSDRDDDDWNDGLGDDDGDGGGDDGGDSGGGDGGGGGGDGGGE